MDQLAPIFKKRSMDIVQVVDDDEAVRDSVRALLEAHDFEVETFASARDYLQASALTARDFSRRSCVLLDVHMPEMDGVSLLRHMRSNGMLVPVIVITGRTDRTIRDAARSAGACAILDKPVREVELIAAIESALHQSIAADA